MRICRPLILIWREPDDAEVHLGRHGKHGLVGDFGVRINGHKSVVTLLYVFQQPSHQRFGHAMPGMLGS